MITTVVRSCDCQILVLGSSEGLVKTLSTDSQPRGTESKNMRYDLIIPISSKSLGDALLQRVNAVFSHHRELVLELIPATKIFSCSLQKVA